jgi:hypothetical protein
MPNAKFAIFNDQFIANYSFSIGHCKLRRRAQEKRRHWDPKGGVSAEIADSTS